MLHLKRLRSKVALVRILQLRLKLSWKKGYFSTSLWKIINRCIPSKSTTKPSYSKDPALTVTNEFNKYFSSVGSLTSQLNVTQLALDHNIDISNSYSDHTQCPDGEQFNFRRVSCYDVQKIVLSMPSNKSPGIDLISMQVLKRLKDSLPIILPALTDIINCSLTTSIFPDAWKKSALILLQKEGDHEIASNNSPLSLLVVASKVCEKIALNQFSEYLTTRRKLTPNQSGNKKTTLLRHWISQLLMQWWYLIQIYCEEVGRY